MGERITFDRPDGGECPAYYVQPDAGDGAPGLVILQEWWGLDQHIRDVAARLAASGYRALVPDLYRGKVTIEARCRSVSQKEQQVRRRHGLLHGRRALNPGGDPRG